MQFAVGRVFHLLLRFSKAGDVFHVGFYYGCSAAPDDLTARDVIDTFNSTVITNMMGCLSSEIIYEGAYCYCCDPNTQRSGEFFGSGTAGTITEESLPTSVAAVIRLHQSNVSGKHNGRAYMLGIPETVCTNSLLDTSYMAGAIALFISTIAAPMSGSGQTYRLCVLQRVDAGTPITPVGNEVTQVVIPRNLSTLKRRVTELRQYHA